MILGGLIVVSAVVRSIVAWHHSIPRLFPDEYIYAALGRSLAHGHLQIRGVTAHFPAVFEPVVAAPIWRLFDVTTAYHLVQVENAVAASLAAIPIYLLARRLGLSTVYSIAAAAYGLLVPELVIIAFNSADAVAYPLALAAVAAAIAALDHPTRSRQVAFLALAALATLTRVEYAVLAPAYVAGAIAVDGRAAHRRHRLALSFLVPAAVLAVVGASTYYTFHLNSWLSRGFVNWVLLQPFLLALEAGVVVAPGAVLGLTIARDRTEKAFIAFVAAFAIGLFAVTARVAAETSEFKERYLFVLLALAPIACGLYLRNRPARRLAALGVAVAIVIAAARLPISGYATSSFKMDSQFLFAVGDLQDRIGIDNASLAVALAATACAGLAALIAFRGHALLPLAVAAAVALTATISATRVDLVTTRAVRANDPRDLRWVDHAAHGRVDAIETPVARKQDLLHELYWNTSIQRELLLGNAFATDAFSAPRLRIAPDGTLEGVTGDVLFHDFGTMGWLAGARRVASDDHFTLWRPEGEARFRLVVQGRFYDGWLNPRGRLRAWPLRRGDGVRVSFQLSLPPAAHRVVRVAIGGGRWIVRPGDRIDVVCTSRGPLDVRYANVGRKVLSTDFRTITARMTHLTVRDGGTRSSPPCTG